MVEQRKNECNLKYGRLLDLLRRKGNLQEVHTLLIEIAEALELIGKLSPPEAAKCRSKVNFLLGIARGITRETKHGDVYFKLTGMKMEEPDEQIADVGQPSGTPAAEEEAEEEAADTGAVKAPDETDRIRPACLQDYIGQDKIKAQIKEALEAAKLKGKPLEHLLLFGSAGLGKTSLAKIIANEMNSRIIIMSGPTIKDPMALVSVIRNVRYGDIVFIDEIHRMNPMAAEAIYTVMEDFELSYLEKDKNGARNVTLTLPPFTVIGATTHSGLLEKPMRDRFTLQFKLDLYSLEDLSKIAGNTMRKLGKNMTEKAADEVAKRSRGIPRNCNSYIRRIYDRALIRNIQDIDDVFVTEYFDAAGIDGNGLADLDIKYLKTICEKFANKPVGIDNLASCLGEGKNIIESQIEPYLLYLGFIQITPSGRILTAAGLAYIGIDPDSKKKLLLT